MKIGITYAIYVTNQELCDLAVASLASITSREHKLVFAGYANHPLKAEHQAALEQFGPVYSNDENNLSRAWNRGIDRLLRQRCRYVFVPNLDIVLASDALDSLVAAVHKRRESLLWTMSTWGELSSIDQAVRTDHWQPYPHFSAYMVDKRLFETVGPFDEEFKPAYDEDLDMHWRIKLAGYNAEHYEGARFYHHGSATIMRDHELRESNNRTHARNSEYFRRKWNDKPATADDPFTGSMFRVPFNDPGKVGFEREYMDTW